MKALSENIGLVRGKKVLLRLDFNVPIARDASGTLSIADDFRIRQALPTISMLHDAGARVYIVAHIESEVTNSLSLVADYLNKIMPVNFVIDAIDYMKKNMTNDVTAPLGTVTLFENIRQYTEEKSNDVGFALLFATFADFFVNDAFSVSHRAHASVVAVPLAVKQLNKAVFAGPLLINEVSNLSKAFSPTAPFLFIVGGAKFETKIALVQKFLDRADFVFVGGALANDILKAQGYPVGKSLVSQGVDLSSVISHPHLIAPIDVLVQGGLVKLPSDVSDDDIILDVGPQTVAYLVEKVGIAKTIVWNGPLGKYQDGFRQSTEELGHAIAVRTKHTDGVDSATHDGALSLIGGGDTLAVVKADDLANMSFVSTGGGAMLDFLASETLPGIDALR